MNSNNVSSNAQSQPTVDHSTATEGSRRGLSAAAAVLWASAFVIAAMVIVQAGKLPSLGSAAHAEMAIGAGNYTLLTTDSGRGGGSSTHELLYVIDSREQVLLVYEVEDARRNLLFLRDGWSIASQFQAARQQ